MTCISRNSMLTATSSGPSAPVRRALMEPNSLDVDTAGNIYVAGHFTGTVALGSDELVSNGDVDAFVAQLNGDGQFMWARGMGGPELDRALSVEVTSDASLYLSGWFRARRILVDKNLSALVKLTASLQAELQRRTALWAHRFGGASSDYLGVYSVDATITSWQVGNFTGVVDFGPFQLTSNQSAGGRAQDGQRRHGHMGVLYGKR